MAEFTVGVFKTRARGEDAVKRLVNAGFDRDRLGFLTPETTAEEVQRIPTTEGEASGVGTALGGSIGGALGLGVGIGLLMPAAAPAFALGAIGTGIATLAGAAGGALLGAKADDAMADGLPVDEVYLYEDALRSGRSVVIVRCDSRDEKAEAERLLSACGAETIDAARENWWVGIRDAEALQYESPDAFDRDEAVFRQGFVAALRPGRAGKSYADAAEELRETFPDEWNQRAFRRGYERGRQRAATHSSHTS